MKIIRFKAAFASQRHGKGGKKTNLQIIEVKFHAKSSKEHFIKVSIPLF